MTDLQDNHDRPTFQELTPMSESLDHRQWSGDVDHEALLDRAERKWRSNARRGVLNAWITTGVSGVSAAAGGVAVGLVLSGRVLVAYPGLQMLALLTALVATTLSVFGVSQGLKLRREYKALWAAEQQTLSTMRSAIEEDD